MSQKIRKLTRAEQAELLVALDQYVDYIEYESHQEELEAVAIILGKYGVETSPWYAHALTKEPKESSGYPMYIHAAVVLSRAVGVLTKGTSGPIRPKLLPSSTVVA